jgi:hypothetical protein
MRRDPLERCWRRIDRSGCTNGAIITRMASGCFFKPVSNRPDRCRLEMGVFDDRDKSMRGVEVAERQRDDVLQGEHTNLSGFGSSCAPPSSLFTPIAMLEVLNGPHFSQRFAS